MAFVTAHRLRVVLLVLIGIGLGVLLGRLVLPPGGPDPVLEPASPTAVSLSPTPSPSATTALP